MALDNYADLQASVLSWLGRAGDTTTPVTDWITLFEAEARRRLRTRWQETTTNLTTTAGTATLALPDDFLSLRSIKLMADPVVKLTYVTPEEMDATWVSASAQQGNEVAYTIEGLNLRLAPTPQSADTITIGYLQGLTALSDSATTNWLLTNHPDAYLFGTLAEAVAWEGLNQADPRLALWLQRREAAFESVLLADRKARWGGGALQMKTDTGNP